MESGKCRYKGKLSACHFGHACHKFANPDLGYGPEYLSRCSDSVRAGRSGDRIQVGARISANFLTGPVAYPAYWPSPFPEGKAGRGVALTTDPFWDRGRRSRAIPIPPMWAFLCYVLRWNFLFLTSWGRQICNKLCGKTNPKLETFFFRKAISFVDLITELACTDLLYKVWYWYTRS